MSQRAKLDLMCRHNQVAEFDPVKETLSYSQYCPGMAVCPWEAGSGLNRLGACQRLCKGTWAQP